MKEGAPARTSRTSGAQAGVDDEGGALGDVDADEERERRRRRRVRRGTTSPSAAGTRARQWSRREELKRRGEERRRRALRRPLERNAARPPSLYTPAPQGLRLLGRASASAQQPGGGEERSDATRAPWRKCKRKRAQIASGPALALAFANRCQRAVTVPRTAVPPSHSPPPPRTPVLPRSLQMHAKKNSRP